MHHPEGNHGYARASPAGPQAAQADLRRRSGRGAHARPGRFRRAAAARVQRLRLRRHLEPPRARQHDPQPGGARHDRRAQSPGGVRRARARRASQRLQRRGNPRGPAAERDVLRHPGRERRAPAGGGSDGATQGGRRRVKVAVRPLLESDLAAADRVFRLASGTEFGLPEPMAFRGDSDLVKTRWRADPAAALGAFRGEELIGSSFAARWGSFGVLGPITVGPDCWENGIGKRLLEPTMALFEGWGIRQAGLFTLPQSPKHVALYQKFGFWPQALTAVMSKPVEPRPGSRPWSWCTGSPAALQPCFELTEQIFPGLDLQREILAIGNQALGETVLLPDAGFAACHIGKGSEAGSGVTYVKFGAVRPGRDAPVLFDRLLAACEALAAERGCSKLVAGVNTARHAAYRSMMERGFRAFLHGVAMQRPNEPGYNRPDCFVIDDWR